MKRIQFVGQSMALSGTLVAAIVSLLISGQAANAAQVFNNRALFLNAAGPLSFEGFEGLPATNTLTSASIVANDFTVTAPNNQLGIFNIPIAGAAATEGSQFLEHQSGANETTIFTFDFPIDSLGFDLLDYGDFGTGQLTLMNNAGDNLVVAVAGGGEGNVRYWGVISDFQFTQAIFTNTIGGESFGFDRMNYGTGIPEPSVFVLLTLGLASVGGCARPRRAVA